MKSKKNTFLLLIAPIILTGFSFLLTEKSNAQILELDQKIFGMDCAPCAKGVENRMKRMNGVQNAELDLNEGEAKVTFSDQNTASLHQIQKSIKDGGFSPKEARIKVRGTLQFADEKWQLITESGDLFVLEDADTDTLESNTGENIIVKGIVAENSGQENWILAVSQL